jgi:hypothetical protein
MIKCKNWFFFKRGRKREILKEVVRRRERETDTDAQ